jgi:S-DNA-T family DNA segregation ATPase FtsK/SpoIIIE
VINNPGINDLLAELDTLKSVLNDFARREEKLNNEFRTKSNAESTLQETRVRTLEQKVTDFSTQAEMDQHATEEHHNSRCQKRLNRVYTIQAAMKRRLAGQVDDLDKQLGGAVREQKAVAEQRRDEELAREKTGYEELQQKLAAAGETLEQLTQTAQKAFGGYGAFRRMLMPKYAWPAPDLTRNEQDLYAEIQKLLSGIPAKLKKFGGLPAPLIFRLIPLWLISLVLLGVSAAPWMLQQFHQNSLPPAVMPGGLIALAVVWIFYFFGLSTARPTAKEIAGPLAAARQLLAGASEKSVQRHESEQARIKQECDNSIWGLNQNWKEQVKDLTSQSLSLPRLIDEKTHRVAKRCAEFQRNGLERIRRQFADEMGRVREEVTSQILKVTNTHQALMAEYKQRHVTGWQTMEADWQAAMEPLQKDLAALSARAVELFPPWQSGHWTHWEPPVIFTNAAQVGRLEVNLKTYAESLPKDPRLAFPATLSLPLLLAYPRQGSILFQTGATGASAAIGAINNLIFRLISGTPPGKLSFTIFDPVGLGENFAALMHLADYEESAINSRIWTQTPQFEEKLAELNEHMEKVIQMYLRNDYATIAEYNAEAGTMAEKYHFLVIASFPVNFSDTASKRLRNIIASGARCGVYVFIQWDQRTHLPQELLLDDLKASCICLTHTPEGFKFSPQPVIGAQIVLEPPPTPEFATEFLHQSGRQSKNSTRVEVPFEQIAPAESSLWQESTIEELRVPIGRSGATKLQYLAIGKGTRQHALIAGKTGSGKSTLFHVIITNLSLWCSPEQVEFYLVDFKKGVEFKCYANRRLPHARVVAIESDRAFGLSVLQRIDEELRRRGDLFRQHGAQDLAGYHRAGGAEALPRSLLLIDEFQEFFVEEDRISQGAAVLLDRIVRQGRAFGIHVLLGSQTLGGAYTLARATIGQMVIRIALQCNETDAYLIMDQDNPAPRLLSRPGEGIYNDSAGSIEGNSPFQAVWLDDQIRDGYLGKIRDHANVTPGKYPGPIIFEGSAPADIRENLLLAAAIATVPASVPDQTRLWLGAPNAIKGPTEAVFKRQSGNNLLLICQSEERTLNLLTIAFLTLALQYPRGRARFIVLDSTPPGFPQREYFQQAIAAVPHEVIQVNNANLTDVMAGLSADLKQPGAEQSTDRPETYILIQGLQNFKKLRPEDEFGFGGGDAGGPPNPAQVLTDLITEGPARGFHLLISVDTYNNVNRCLGRKALSEFEMRVLFQMSASDSASLIDSPDAGNLGFHRALLYLDREGISETFRPYAPPGNDWLEEVRQVLAKQV